MENAETIAEDQNGLVTPETFEEVGRRILRGDPIYEGEDESGFLKKGYRRVLVGYRVSDESYVIGTMKKSTSTINRNEPRLKTREHTSIVCEFFRHTGDFDVSDIDVDEFNQRDIDDNDAIEYIDTGYVNGYRVERMEKTVDEIFKWY